MPQSESTPTAAEQRGLVWTAAGTGGRAVKGVWFTFESAYVIQVSTAAVVSWPAMSSVIRSSRICVLSTSSPRRSTRKRSIDGSVTLE